jgi:integrase
MHLRQRYQHGCLMRKKRTRGDDVWEFRYCETTTEGQRRRRSVLIGSVARFPTWGRHYEKWSLCGLN